MPLWHEWGHWLTLVLGVFGISQRGVDMLRAAIGLPPCKCSERADAINAIGERLATFWGRAVALAGLSRKR